MRLKMFSMFLLLGMLISCKKDKLPAGVLSKVQMADLITHIYLAEARTNNLSFTRDSSYRLFVPFQDSLLRAKGVQDSTLRKSYEYYLGHPSELEGVYDIVIDSLSLLEQQTRPVPPS